MSRRVVITGVGAISALGDGVPALWDAAVEGRSGIDQLEGFGDSRLKFRNGAQIRGFDPARFFESREDQLLDPCVQFAIIPAREAVKDSGIAWDDELRSRTAVVTGCAVGGKNTEDAEYYKLYHLNKKRFHPFAIPRSMGNAGASRISMEFGLQGPAFTLSTACSSANHAIGHAFWLLRNGAADAAVAGGHEALFTLGHLLAWDALRVVAPDTCRPFSADRKGMVIGEGGGMLVLETLDRAQTRGARIHAEIVGFGMSADAHHLTMPSMEGPSRAMTAAMADGSLRREEIGYVSAHGTGTLANDPNEINAVKHAFGDLASNLTMSSTKAVHGHALGASGALEAVITTLALSRGVLPPTANYLGPDPKCDLDVIPNEAREKKVSCALSNSFAFGGLNAVVAFRRFEPDA
ncbi:MAG: beta-ACP synthase [Planctomycetes bacterium]|nr:beta-ACP synthase [Planctomycetota bacterium]